ncbi:MAG: hypothetical protein WC590_13740 [Burkholderiaceae bacterium]
MTDMTTRLQAMLDAGQDNLLLRFSLGKAMFEQDRFDVAIEHLTQALVFDAQFSNAWKLLGRARLALNDQPGARQAFEAGLLAAQTRGDAQVAKEIVVFLKRLDKMAAAAGERASAPEAAGKS